MSKYIIEIAKEYEEYFKGVLICGIADGKFAVDVIAREDLEELNSDYINEHYGELQDEAYQKGINDGSLDVKQRVEGAYQRGLEDAWEAAKKIALMDTETSEKVTGYFGLFRIMENLTPMQAIEKLKAYEDKRPDRIEVGDEVATETGIKYTVVSFGHGGTVCGFNAEGKWTGWKPKEVTKTGKHYDIASILEAMRTHD